MLKNNLIVYIKYMYVHNLDMLSKVCAPVQKTSILTMSQTWNFECHEKRRRQINSGRIKCRQQKRRGIKILKK